MATIEIEFKDELISRIREAFDGLADNELKMFINNRSGKRIMSTTTFSEQTSAETLQEYGNRVASTLIKMAIRLYELEKDSNRYRTQVSQISGVDVDIPDDIIS